jgi:hypothetical protein
LQPPRRARRKNEFQTSGHLDFFGKSRVAAAIDRGSRESGLNWETELRWAKIVLP